MAEARRSLGWFHFMTCACYYYMSILIPKKKEDFSGSRPLSQLTGHYYNGS